MFTKLRDSIKAFSFPDWSVPLGLLGLCVAAFGLFIPMLGVYWDDWEIMLVTRLYPINIGLWKTGYSPIDIGGSKTT
ncbi:MAG: hypothetical protein HN929_09815 [Chloroflexi bacterium]|nr:hypothetical protein [Chloroflexota bacterium]